MQRGTSSQRDSHVSTQQYQIGQDSTTMRRRWLTVSEVAEMLSLSNRKIYALIQEGKLGGVKIDSAIRIPVDALDEWIREKEVATQESRIAYGTKARA